MHPVVQIGFGPDAIMCPTASISKLGNPVLLEVATANKGSVPSPVTDSVPHGVEVAPTPKKGFVAVVSTLNTFAPTALKMLKALIMLVGVLNIMPPAEVEEAKSPAVSNIGVEVADITTPKFVVGVKGYAAPPPPEPQADPVPVSTPALKLAQPLWPDTIKVVVDAYVALNSVEVELLNCCKEVQMFELASASEATTAPVVGLIVRVPSKFETLLTAPPPLPQSLPVPDTTPLISCKHWVPVNPGKLSVPKKALVDEA